MPIARHRIKHIHRLPDLATIMGMFYTNIDVNTEYDCGDFDCHTHSPQAPHLTGPTPDYNFGLSDCVEQRLADFGEYMEEQIDPEHDTDNATDYWAAELGAEYAYDEED